MDRREHVPGAQIRPALSRVELLVVHKIGAVKLRAHMVRHGWIVGRSVDDFAVIERFFLEDAEGVSTVTSSGRYAERKPTVLEWYRDGVPEANLRRAHVPYHLVVGKGGDVTQFLDLDRAGAHAGGTTNGVSIGVALVGDFVEQAPTAAQRKGLRETLRDLLVEHPSARVVTHDAVLSEPKGCPGAALDLDSVARWSAIAADAVRTGARRR